MATTDQGGWLAPGHNVSVEDIAWAAGLSNWVSTGPRGNGWPT